MCCYTVWTCPHHCTLFCWLRNHCSKWRHWNRLGIAAGILGHFFFTLGGNGPAWASHSSQTPSCNSQRSSGPTCCASLTDHTFASQHVSYSLMILFILYFHALSVHCALTDVQQDRAIIVRAGVHQHFIESKSFGNATLLLNFQR